MIRMGRQEVKEQTIRRVVRLVNSSGQIATDEKAGVTGVQAAPMPGVGPASMFTREEEAYLVWGEGALRAFKTDLDEHALAEIGLTETEIAGIRGLWRVYERAGAPPGACGDELRDLLAGLDWLPRQDKRSNHITEASFLLSAGITEESGADSGRGNPGANTGKAREYRLPLRQVVRHAEAGGYDSLWLSGVFRKIVAWCDCFASIHGLVDRSRDESVQVCVEETQRPAATGSMAKEPGAAVSALTAGAGVGGTRGAASIEADDDWRSHGDGSGALGTANNETEGTDETCVMATEKQRRFLNDLVTARYGPSTAMMFNFGELSKEEASRQIEILRSMRDEQVPAPGIATVTQTDITTETEIKAGRRQQEQWEKKVMVSCMR